VQLEDVVQEIARDAAFEAQARNIQVECEILDELPASGDPALLRSAIENVVRNATRYTRPNTAVAIRAEKRKSGNSDTAYIQVRDSGPGVSEDELEKIFQPFYRIDDARERSTGGVGLGLAITDQAIRLHGGSVRASNLPEGGLLVEMHIPLQPGQGLQEQRAPVVADKV
jgi:two-component system sensor histidine kinase CpxA